MENWNWENKKVFITGGTSGLGRALALQLLSAGARVAILARTQAAIDELLLQQPRLIGIQGDVSNKNLIYPITEEVQSRLGDLDVLFNVASYLGATPLRPLMDTDCEDLEAVLQTNLVGPFRFTKALLAPMILRREGVVVNISSDAAVSAYPNWGSYGASKAALDHMTRIFQEELREQGIRFLAVDPGDMNTPMHRAAIPNADLTLLRRPEQSAIEILQLIENRKFETVRRSL